MLYELAVDLRLQHNLASQVVAGLEVLSALVELKGHVAARMTRHAGVQLVHEALLLTGTLLRWLVGRLGLHLLELVAVLVHLTSVLFRRGLCGFA